MGKRERRALERARAGANGAPAARLNDLPSTTSSGAQAPPLAVGYAALPTSERHVLGESVTHRCVELIADAIAGARWGEWRGNRPLEESRLVRRPAQRYTRREWSWRVAATLALYSYCPLLRVGPEDSEGVIGSLVPVLPSDVARSPATGEWLYRGEPAKDGVRIIRRTVWPVLDDDVASILTLARDVFAAAISAAAYDAAFWESGGAPRTVLTTDKPLVMQQADELRNTYVRQRQDNPGQPAVLSGGLKLEAFGTDAASDGATNSSGRIGAAVARYFGIPPHMANVPNYASSMTYQNTETASVDLVKFTLGAYTGAIGDAMSEELPGDYLTGRAVRLGLEHLTAAEQESRFRSYGLALGKWMTREEIREREGLPPVPIVGEFAAPAPAPALVPDTAPAGRPLALVEGGAA